MSENGKIIFNTGVRWGGEIVNKVIWFVFIVVLARRLGTDGFGYFNYAFSFGSLLVTFTDLGTNIFLLKEIAKAREKASYYLTNIFAVKIIISVIVAVIAVLIPKDSPQVALAVFLFTASLIISAFLDPFNSLFRANKHMQYETMIMLCWRILLVGLSLAGLLCLKIGLTGVAIAFIIASVIAVIIAILAAEKVYKLRLIDRANIDMANWPKLVKGTLVLGFILIIGGMFNKLNVIILQYLGTAQEVGWYGAAFKLVEGTFFVPSIFIGSLFPFLCENNERNTITESGYRLFKKGFIFLLLISAAVALAVTFLSGPIIRLLYGAPFMPAANALKVLVWALVFIYVNELFTYLFLSIERQKSMLKILCVALGVYLLSSVIFIPRYGYTGAAMVLLVTQAILFLLNIKLFMRIKC